MNHLRFYSPSNDSSCALREEPIFFLYEQDLPDHLSFSVAAWDAPHHNMILAEDITDNLEIAEQFLQLLLQEAVSPRHLIDILEDCLPLR